MLITFYGIFFLLNSIPLSKSFDPLYPRLSVVKRRHSGILAFEQFSFILLPCPKVRSMPSVGELKSWSLSLLVKKYNLTFII